MRDCREYFEKVERDYKERVKISKDIVILSKVDYREFLRDYRELLKRL